MATITRFFAGGLVRIWLLTAGLAALALVVIATGVADAPDRLHPDRLSWWAIAALFYVAEANVVHVHFRGDAHSFSLSEIPLVLGLLFLDPASLLVAHGLGAGGALVVHRRQSAHKLAFNVVQFVLSTAMALVVFAALAGPTPFEARTWVAAFAATLVSGLVGVVVIVAAISLSQNRLVVDRLRQVVALVTIGTISNTSLGLLAGRLLWRDLQGLWLVVIPAATLLAAYRAYIAERQKHQSLQFIYESARILHRSPEVDEAVMAVLAHARETFRAETAEIVLLTSGTGTAALRCRVGPATDVETMEPVELDQSELTLMRAARREGVLMAGGGATDAADSSLAARGIKDAMIAALQADGRVVGVMLVGNRLGEVATFDEEDIRLFETLTHHVSVALENGQLERSLAQLRRLEEELKEQAFHDALTGLANRSLLTDRIEHALARRGPRPIAVLFIDLDDFKTVNDSLGHAAGDQLLVSVAQRIKGCIRPSDTAGRLGGDEFAVVLEDAGGLGEAMRVAERIIEALRTPFHLQDTSVGIGASIGIAVGMPGEKAADDLVSDADVAMYTAKSGGKGGFEIFEPGMRTAVQRRHELKSELQRAVTRDEFVVHYQPVVELATGRITGVEALVRWYQPERGLLLPGKFIPLAEETGLILPIGRRVLEQACRDASRWQRRFPSSPPLTFGVNLSARQLQQQGFVTEVLELLRVANVPPQSVVLEITESLLMQDTDANVRKLQDLRRMGVRLAIDDFGTGYSSLSYLRNFPIDILKVAKPFVDELVDAEGKVAFAEAIIRLGQSLDLELVAEGIESQPQLERLRELGCMKGQGFLFAPALDARSLEGFLASGGSPGDVPLAVAGA